MGVSVSFAHKFSKRCPEKYDVDAVEKIWESYQDTYKYSIYTVIGWLKKDLSAEEYKNFQEVYTIYESEDEKLLDEEDVGKAKLVYNKCKDTIIIYDKHGNSFVWNENKRLWEDTSSVCMLSLISQVLSKAVNDVINGYKSQIKDVEPGKDKEVLNEKIKKLRVLSRAVRKASILKNVLTMCIGQDFYNERIHSLLGGKPDQLPIANGKVINLKTKEIRERTRADMFHFTTNIIYTPGPHPNAKKYFSTICGGDTDMIRFFQLYLGYCLTGYTDERKIYIHWGEGLNGKTFLFEMMKEIMGEYYTTISQDVLIKKVRNGGATPELLGLIGARLACYSESEDGSELYAGRIKLITGEDTIVARPLYKEQIRFKPVVKVCMITNHKPKWDINDQAMVDRIELIPFLQRFEKTQENKRYIDSVRREYINEIGSFLIDGASDGLGGSEIVAPDMSQKAMKEYLEELDSVMQFIKERCEMGYKNLCKVIEMKNAYLDFCITELREKSLSVRLFNKRMEKLGYTRESSRINNKICKCWKGLKVLPKDTTDGFFHV